MGNDAMKDHINNNNPRTLIRDPTNIRSKDEQGQLQVELESLAAGVTHVEETLQRLSDEQLSGQLAVVKYALATLEELETEAGSAVDRQTLSASITSCRTRIVTLNTQALASKGRLEGYMAERKKRVIEIKRYQALLVDLEAWLGEAQSTISSEIKLTSAKVVRDQIRASQTLEADLRSRSGQLDHLLKEVDGLSTYTDVQSLVHEMKDNLGTLMEVMKEAQACLAQRLANLQEILRKMVIGYPEGTNVEKELAVEPSSSEPVDVDDIESFAKEIEEQIRDDWEVVEEDESLRSVVKCTFPDIGFKGFSIQPPSIDESLTSKSEDSSVTA